MASAEMKKVQAEKKGHTDLTWAAWEGDFSAVKHILTTSPSHYSETTSTGHFSKATALMCAAHKGHLAIVKWLVGWCARNDHPVSEQKDEFGNTPLLHAAYGGNLLTVSWLLAEAGCSVKEHNQWNQTSLLQSVIGGHLEVAKWLVAQTESSLTEASHGGKTALFWACSRNHKEIVEWLIEQGADLDAVDAENGDTPLMIAAWHGFEKIVECLIDHGADVDCADTAGNTVLHAAACSGSLSTLHYLVWANDFPLMKKNAHGQTAIHQNAFQGTLHTLIWLCEELWKHDQPDCHVQPDKQGHPPMVWATIGANLPVMIWLANNMDGGISHLSNLFAPTGIGSGIASVLHLTEKAGDPVCFLEVLGEAVHCALAEQDGENQEPDLVQSLLDEAHLDLDGELMEACVEAGWISKVTTPWTVGTHHDFPAAFRQTVQLLLWIAHGRAKWHGEFCDPLLMVMVVPYFPPVAFFPTHQPWEERQLFHYHPDADDQSHPPHASYRGLRGKWAIRLRDEPPCSLHSGA
eukprot:TRINITY_DN66724_c4_g2_i1.p1 TRINITY_DN66724_c4_g2~~TRINITY_DN66724_c4_g2_i1.p1  ORF type:complete len:520 (+),score=28.25 TRINITY_DN66724_c4_g2_i1:13-1572(+)